MLDSFDPHQEIETLFDQADDLQRKADRFNDDGRAGLASPVWAEAARLRTKATQMLEKYAKDQS